MLSLFISHGGGGGKLVKETYNLLKSSPKRQVGEGDAAAEDRDRHIRNQLVLGTINESTRQLALSENLDLKALSSSFFFKHCKKKLTILSA